MVKYLIIAFRSGLSDYQATFYERKITNYELFDFIERTTNTLPELTIDNYNTVVNGRITGNNIDDIEPVMRAIGFKRCDICGAWVPPQDCRNHVSVYRNRQRYCALCKAKLLDSQLTTTVHGYHDTSSQVKVINAVGENFTISNVFGIGIEVEGYNGNSTYDTSEIKCTNAFYPLVDKLFRVEHDGSVTFEIISNIFTKKSLYDFDFKILTDMLVLNGNIENNDEAGLHVHLSKCWLGSTAKEQYLNFLKLQYFMKSYENDFLKMSGRKRDEMYYCQFFSHSEIERMKNHISDINPWGWANEYVSRHGGGGCALNSSRATIEFRIGKNTNDPKRLEHYVKFLLGITEGIKNVPFEKLYCLKRVLKLVPQETLNYWRKQGCFLNTIATNDRGLSI